MNMESARAGQHNHQDGNVAGNKPVPFAEPRLCRAGPDASATVRYASSVCESMTLIVA